MSTAPAVVSAFVRRDLLLLKRNSASLVSMFVVPPLFLVCLWAVFGYAAEKTNLIQFDYLEFVLAGCLFQAAMFTAAASSMVVAHDATEGFIDRVRTLPRATIGFILGRAVTDVVRMAGSVVALLLVAALLGLDVLALPLGWLCLWLLVVTIALSLFANGLVLASAKPIEAASSIQSFEMLLLMFSTAFIPQWALTSALKTTVTHMPFSPIIEVIRNPSLPTEMTSTVWEAVAWIAAAALVGAFIIAKRLGGRRES